MKLTIKQTQALDYLEDYETNELLFGGGAGGGKSAFGCYWQLKRRLMFPGTRGLIGRSKLKTLKDTTLKTFFEIAEMQGLVRDKHFWLTGSHDKENPNCIMFANGSMIYLKDLFQYPSDKDFDNLGSFEITDAFIDECNQVVERGKDVVKSRIRYKLDQYCDRCGSQEKKKIISRDETGKAEEWICGNGHTTSGLIPKLLMTCNPAKNWVYSSFYKPFKEKCLDKSKKFIQSLLSDNPYLSKHYKTNLLSMAKDLVQRLLYGNWEYNDDPLLLFPNYDRILEIFTNTFVEDKQKEAKEQKRYITADIAYEGSDKFVIGVWKGLVCIKIVVIDKVDETLVAKKIEDVRQLYKIPISNVLYDADGLKKYVRQSAKEGYLKGAIQFHNGAKPKGKENYKNLKTQCYFKLAEMIENGLIYIKDKSFRDIIIKELEQIKQLERSDNSEPLRLEKKADLKERLGHSPDFVDMLAMRMYFLLAPKRVFETESETISSINY